MTKKGYKDNNITFKFKTKMRICGKLETMTPDYFNLIEDLGQ